MTTPTEPPLACHDCGRVIGPRAARTVVGVSTSGDELLRCRECSKKAEPARPVGQLEMFGGAA